MPIAFFIVKIIDLRYTEFEKKFILRPTAKKAYLISESAFNLDERGEQHG